MQLITKKTQRTLATLLLCVPMFSSAALAQVIGADLAADVSTAEDSKTSSQTNIFQSGTTTLSLSDELYFRSGKTLDQNNYSAKAEFWSKGVWGISGNFQENDLNLFGLPKDSEFKRIDVNRKFLQSANSDSYLAVGLGWQSLNIEDAIESDGLNVSLLGKYAFSDKFLFYGNGTLFQGLDQSDNQDVFGYQFEAGLNYKLGSKLSFSAGLKISDLESQEAFRQSRSFSSSFLIGTSLAF